MIELLEPHPEPIIELLKRKRGRDPEFLDKRRIRETYPSLNFALLMRSSTQEGKGRFFKGIGWERRTACRLENPGFLGTRRYQEAWLQASLSASVAGSSHVRSIRFLPFWLSGYCRLCIGRSFSPRERALPLNVRPSVFAHSDKTVKHLAHLADGVPNGSNPNRDAARLFSYSHEARKALAELGETRAHPASACVARNRATSS